MLKTVRSRIRADAAAYNPRTELRALDSPLEQSIDDVIHWRGVCFMCCVHHLKFHSREALDVIFLDISNNDDDVPPLEPVV